MPELLDLHGQAVAEFDRRVAAVQLTEWANPTPCASWDVHDLVNHLVTEQLWVPHLLGGGTIAEAAGRFDGDRLGEEPYATWQIAAREARTAWLQPGAPERTVHLSFGDVPAAVYLEQMTFDLTVHAWDLARGIGADEKLDRELVEAMLAWAQRQDFFGGGGLFDDPVPVPDDADPQVRLLARTGRRA
ncbi:TIGR03086 family metal-binding protein [Marinitenerispora sediminis]|uniref:TIGR03086 family protein n=1 Tax=Marinitenerispora sediminis TaxID=1931232 RepID=A0A368TA93_9ACTN|nr:TIGR03086 family metal-binding protein [Marinitenerispora sediminis]RCV53382.1 TIGR03086 family protein [Marinitenerispora sediminis]RCV58422.1 TIGR03086 family protein [Marinitenerispora sediminis]RCV61797.1 TIGR03086 family protein [Marinitenerispora sediminis]